VRLRIGLVLTLLFVAYVAAVAGRSDAHDSAVRNIAARNDLERGVLVEINAFRRRHGLSALRVNGALRAAADVHSSSMATRGFFAHESPDGTLFWKRVRRYYAKADRAYWSVGENLLWSSPDVDADGALRMWLNSPPHRRTLLTPEWREIGLGAVHVASAPGMYGGREVTILTADFGVRR
jgi:uncharacterized protein YkwD